MVWSSPAQADLNNDDALDVVVCICIGIGVGICIKYNGAPAQKVFAIKERAGGLLYEGATSGALLDTPTVGGVDGDGRPEVFAVSHGNRVLFAEGENSVKRWNFCIRDGDAHPGSSLLIARNPSRT